MFNETYLDFKKILYQYEYIYKEFVFNYNSVLMYKNIGNGFPDIKIH